MFKPKSRCTRNLPEETKRAIIYDYVENKISAQQLAIKYNLGWQPIVKFLRKNGIVTRSVSEAKITNQDDMIGKRFGLLVVLNRDGNIVPCKFNCKCDCGKEKSINKYSLTGGETKSCGCASIEWITASYRKYPKDIQPLYNRWRAMMARCHNPNSTRYSYYGARGIIVCEEWHTFENFAKDMKLPPFKGASIDRIDNNGNYCKENCRWATKTEQGRNTRRNNIITFNGKTQCLQEWANELGIISSSLIQRLKEWPLEKALTQKRKNYRKSLFNPKNTEI